MPINDGATLIRKASQVVIVTGNGKEPKIIKEILQKTTKHKRRTAVMEQAWVGKDVTALGWKRCNSAFEGSRNSSCMISDIQRMEEHPRYSPVSGHVH